MIRLCEEKECFFCSYAALLRGSLVLVVRCVVVAAAVYNSSNNRRNENNSNNNTNRNLPLPSRVFAENSVIMHVPFDSGGDNKIPFIFL